MDFLPENKLINLINNASPKSKIYIVTPEKPKHLPKIGTLEVIKGYNNNQ